MDDDEDDGLDGVTYYPPDFGFSPEEARRNRLEGRWMRAREDYLAGATAETVCLRHGLAIGTLRARAAREGWRRCDQDEPAAPPQDDSHLSGLGLSEDVDPGEDDYTVLSRRALVNVARAMGQGRAGEAGSWMRLHERLSRMAEAAHDGPPAPQPTRPPSPPEPDPMLEVEEDIRAIQAMTRRLAAIDTSDPAARAAFEADMERMQVCRRRAEAFLGDPPNAGNRDSRDPVFPPNDSFFP